jgi:histidyl-tRNA synthetase
MVYAHEIPAGSRLYFGESAAIKRDIEATAARILSEAGYEEIVTPYFSYHQHESFDDTRELVRLNDEENHEVSLRADSTADVIRIVTKRLGRSSEAKKWFYIQPVLDYPTKESYQAGAETIGGEFAETAADAAKLVRMLGMKPVMQLSNMRIPQLLMRRYGAPASALKSMHIAALLKIAPWMEKLVAVDSIEDLKDLSSFPDDIAAELEALRQAAEAIDYPSVVIAPLYFAKLRYYDALLFRMIKNNRVVAMGGSYRIDDIEASGFALYIDECIAWKMKEGKTDE